MQKLSEPSEYGLATLAMPGEDDCDRELPGGSMPVARNPACGAATCIGQAGHTLPDLILNVTTATIAAGAVVAIGLLAIAWLQ